MTDETRQALQKKLSDAHLSLSGMNSDVGDYRVIKMFEAKMRGVDDPYDDSDKILTKRQEIRDLINTISGILNDGTSATDDEIKTILTTNLSLS